MKKNILFVSLIALGALAWCAMKVPSMPVDSTWEVEVTSGVQTEIITGDVVTTWTVATSEVSTGAENLTGSTWTMDEIKDLIDARASQPKDKDKLDEADIDLMDRIIQKVKQLGK